MLSANLVNAISLLSLPTIHLIASAFAQTGMSAANPDQISNTGALLPPPLTHWIVCSVSYGPPMIAITPSNNFMWPGNYLMGAQDYDSRCGLKQNYCWARDGMSSEIS
jgi:hypothetical protein